MRLRPHELAFLDRGGVLIVADHPRYRIVLVWLTTRRPG
jgi:hypothetical protein